MIKYDVKHTHKSVPAVVTIIGTRSFTQNLLNEKKSVIATSHARIHETCKTIKMPPTSAKKGNFYF